MGFPGLNMTGGNIKLAQQNFGEHFRALKSLVDYFHPDAIFPMMDLSVEANALGRYTIFPKQESATVVKDHFSMEDLKLAKNINISFDTRLQGYVETIKLLSIGLPSTVLKGAYVTGPYTLAALLMGADEAVMASMMNPDLLHEVCQLTTEKILEYVRLLITAGAQAICVLEPSAVMLGPDQFEQFSGKYVESICEICKYTHVATIYHTCGNCMHLIEKMCESGVNAISLDSPEIGIDMFEAARRSPAEMIIMGNISPTGNLLTGKPSDVERDVYNLLDVMKPYANFILSTGCDLPQETPLDNINTFIETVRKYRLK
ncbi:MAG: uroporphyrinogen decarboxylase (URO-D) [Calditrichaeota bacterium]|nr:MAG: uroporphyrinogen decarboxylase (URO-D) [Calditrichota bacterium]